MEPTLCVDRPVLNVSHQWTHTLCVLCLFLSLSIMFSGSGGSEYLRITWCLSIIPWWTLDHHKPGSCGWLWTSLCVDVYFGFAIFSVPIFRRVTQLQVGRENSSIRASRCIQHLPPPPHPRPGRRCATLVGGEVSSGASLAACCPSRTPLCPTRSCTCP